MASRKSVVITDGGNAEIVSSLDQLNTEGVTTVIPTVEIPQIGNVDDAATTVMESAPEVQPHVVEQHTREKAAAPGDVDGTPFDASIHAVGSDGQGIKTAKGQWRKRRGAAKAGAKSVVGNKASAGSAAGSATADAAAVAAGRAFAQLTFMCGRAFGGEEWAPILLVENGVTKYDEDAFMTEAYTEWCKAKNIKDVPPGVILSVALISYAAPRMRMPETQKRVAGLKTRIATWWISWRARRAERKAMKRQSADNRNTEK
jgi:hypothetical protein